MKNDDRDSFLNAPLLPARLQAAETAWYLGFKPHQIPILVGAGLLCPLGHPPANTPKFFLTATLTALRSDGKWFAKATDAISAHWRRKNARRRTGQPGQSNTSRTSGV